MAWMRGKAQPGLIRGVSWCGRCPGEHQRRDSGRAAAAARISAWLEAMRGKGQLWELDYDLEEWSEGLAGGGCNGGSDEECTHARRTGLSFISGQARPEKREASPRW
jgi:hypothetical protein